MKPPKALLVRASISFPSALYQNLETLAKRKKVSLAWVVREAAERYVAEEILNIQEGSSLTSTGTRKTK
ncbi:MAG: CopG family transcriptional regulator [Chthoniobacterales bacterium]